MNQKNQNIYTGIINPLDNEIKALMKQGKYNEALKFLESKKETFLEFPNEGLMKYNELKGMIDYQLRRMDSNQ